MPAEIVNAFTVDVEDYFQVSGFERDIPRTAWGSFECRVVDSTQRLLELLSRNNVRGTFFILGWIAARYPRLVREIQQAGHELGSHSYWHRLIYDLSPQEFRQDLRDSIAAISDAAGVAVTSFRAPSFSITARSLWALELLAECGIRVDSSIFPLRHDRYGMPEAATGIHALETPAGTICEFPPTVASLFNMNLPAAGGGYFRMYPWSVMRQLLNQVQRQGRPLMFYVHPWEVDPEQPRLSAGSAMGRFRHYLNLATTLPKLERLLGAYRFGTMSESIASWESSRLVSEEIAPSTATEMRELVQ